MGPRERHVISTMAGHAHRDAHEGEPDRVTAGRYGIARKTASDRNHRGAPWQRDASSYLLNCPQPWRLIADLKAIAKARLREKPLAELVEAYHQLLELSKRLEGEDNAMDARRNAGWLNRSLARERDAAVDEELAAIEREFACRGTTEEEVFAWAP